VLACNRGVDGDSCDRKVAAPLSKLQEGPTIVCPLTWKPDLRNEFPGLQTCLECAFEERFRRYFPLAGFGCQQENASERDRASRQFGRRIAKSQTTANRPPIPYRDVRNVFDCLGQQREEAANNRRLQDLRVCGQRPDPHNAVVKRNALQLVEFGNVDQKLGTRKTEIQGCQKTLAASEGRCGGPDPRQKAERFAEVTGSRVGKIGRLHCSFRFVPKSEAAGWQLFALRCPRKLKDSGAASRSQVREITVDEAVDLIGCGKSGGR
jgi:hypothetical protein